MVQVRIATFNVEPLDEVDPEDRPDDAETAGDEARIIVAGDINADPDEVSPPF